MCCYKKYNYYYLDSHVGDKEFIGEELVWHNEKVCWGMNYKGQVLVNEAPSGFNKFLRSALKTYQKILHSEVQNILKMKTLFMNVLGMEIYLHLMELNQYLIMEMKYLSFIFMVEVLNKYF